MSINLLIVYSRSGGTILNQCLATLPNTVVLSELSQWGGGTGHLNSKSHTTVWGQAKAWYGISIKSRQFLDAVLELEEYCLANNLHLIIRDWTYASFNSFSLNQEVPSRTLETLQLLKEKTKVQAFCFIRNAIDVWISSGKPPVDLFFEAYQPYVKAIVAEGLPIFKYEDFCTHPDETMKSICKVMAIPFNPDYKTNYQEMDANGNTQLGQHSRGIRQNKIAPLQRKWIRPSQISEIDNASQQINCNKIIGYETSYFDKNFKPLNYCYAAGEILKEKTYSKLFSK